MKLTNKKKIRILEQLAEAQTELLLIVGETMDTIDSSDIAVVSIHDPMENEMIGKNLHEIRAEHADREDELHDEINDLYEQLDYEEAPPTA